METTKNKFNVSSATLHIIAMATMLIDHLSRYVDVGFDWVIYLGRLAFPIFAFMTVEGYFHTRNFKKYMLRMLIFALLSEIPYNLMKGEKIFCSYDQNVIWTFMLALICIWVLELIKKKNKKWLYIVSVIIVAFAGYLLGHYLLLDYLGEGVLMVLTFYLFREHKWQNYLIQFAIMFVINVLVLGEGGIFITLFSKEIELPLQGCALFALIPIWLYRGRQGFHNKPFQYFCYAFYPVHMLILVLIFDKTALLNF